MDRQNSNSNHPFESGISPWSDTALHKSAEWKYCRGDSYCVEFAADPIGVIFIRISGWSTEEDIRAASPFYTRIVNEMQWNEKPLMLHFDCTELQGMDLSARRLFFNNLFTASIAQGVAFCSPCSLIKSYIQLGRTFRRSNMNVSICDGWQQGCNEIRSWLKDRNPECTLPEIQIDYGDGGVAEDQTEIDKVLSIISEVEWAAPGASGDIQAVDISPSWKPFLDVISLLKHDLDNLNIRRSQRLAELQEETVREETLQKQMSLALVESQRARSNFEQESRRNITLSRVVVDTQKETLFALGEIIESRSKETANHVRRVAEYSVLLARFRGMDEREQQYIMHASPMHDAGKVAIPDAVLNKPGKLTDEEFEIMKSHARKGYDMLKGAHYEIMAHAATIAYQHHEKWNGKGYPNGLIGEAIHPFGRIVALADVFDALGSDRCYKKAWPLEKIFDLLQKEKGEQFDPELVDVFFNNISEFLMIRERFPDAIS